MVGKCSNCNQISTDKEWSNALSCYSLTHVECIMQPEGEVIQCPKCYEWMFADNIKWIEEEKE